MFVRLIVALMIGLVTSTFAEETTNVRLALHGGLAVNQTTGFVGWAVFPNVTSAPDKVLFVTGVGHRFSKTLNIEVMGGVYVQKGVRTPLVDIRLNQAVHIGVPVKFWADIQWVDPTGVKPYLYTYGQALTPIKSIWVGIETEDSFRRNAMDTISFGPVLVAPLREMKLAVAYQFHQKGNRQAWGRVVIDF